MHAIQVNKLGLGEYFKVEPTDLASVHGVFAEWGCNTALTADQLETKLAVPPLIPQHSTAQHTRARARTRTARTMRGVARLVQLSVLIRP